MSEAIDDTENFIDAAAELIPLSIHPDHRPGVKQFLEVAREMAGLLDQADLDEGELALAPVFAPPHAHQSGRGS